MTQFKLGDVVMFEAGVYGWPRWCIDVDGGGCGMTVTVGRVCSVVEGDYVAVRWSFHGEARTWYWPPNDSPVYSENLPGYLCVLDL